MKVRLLTQHDYDMVQSYLDKNPLHNIYPIYGLQIYGLKSEKVRFWGAFDKGQLEAILFIDLLYARHTAKPRYGYLTGENPDVLAQLGKIALKAKVKDLMGKEIHIRPIVQELSSRANTNTRVSHLNFSVIYPEKSPRSYDYPVRAATLEDIPLLTKLYQDSGFKFSSNDETEAEVILEMQRTIDEAAWFLLELEGRAIAASRIAIKTDQAGLIAGGFTLPEFRGRGMYTSIRTAVAEYLESKNIVGVDFVLVDNDPMNKFARKSGDVFIDRWSVVHLGKKPPLRRRILPVGLRRWGMSVRDKILG